MLFIRRGIETVGKFNGHSKINKKEAYRQLRHDLPGSGNRVTKHPGAARAGTETSRREPPRTAQSRNRNGNQGRQRRARTVRAAGKKTMKLPEVTPSFLSTGRADR